MPPQGTKEKTEAENLQEILGLIGESLAAPDADQQFLMGLQQAIVQHLQQKKQQQQQQTVQAATMGGAQDPNQQQGQPGQPGQPGLGPPPPPNQSGLAGRAGPPGLSTLTDPGEIQRMLAGSGQIG